jgi:hypothetical protein
MIRVRPLLQRELAENDSQVIDVANVRPLYYVPVVTDNMRVFLVSNCGC